MQHSRLIQESLVGSCFPLTQDFHSPRSSIENWKGAVHNLRYHSELRSVAPKYFSRIPWGYLHSVATPKILDSTLDNTTMKSYQNEKFWAPPT